MCSVISLIFLLLLCTNAEAALSFDAVSTGTAASSNTVSTTHTRGCGGTNTYAVVSVAWQLGTPGTVSSVSYGGTALALLRGQTIGGGDARVEMWGVKAPPGGAQTVTATMSSTPNSLTMTTRTYCGVDQTTSTGTAVSAANFLGTASVDATSAAGELVVDAVVLYGGGEPLTVGSGQTERSNFYEGACCPPSHTHGTSEEAGAGTITMDWTQADSQYWAIVAVALKPAATATRRFSAPIVMQ